MINDVIVKDSFKKINKIVDKTTTTKIQKGIEEFSNQYAEINDASHLINDIYKMKVDEIIDILSKSDYIINQINTNIIKPDDLCNMKPHELDPERYENILEKKKYESNKLAQKGSSVYSCKKCNQSNCVVTQKQTRSADEPATTFVTCLECGYSFRC
jgi:DNA-directed RNA polymerase subunit M/transcription elongation factor TFIIS